LDCREFETLLPRYLDGALREPELARMVRHEASCRRCHALAVGGMRDPAAPIAAAAWTAETLRRTLGADCRHIERILAMRGEAPPGGDEARRIEQHLVECRECNALDEVLRALPSYYEALPRLRADRAFTRRVLRGTVGRELRLRTVLRVLWRSPTLLWEGALTCSLLFTPFLGRPALEGARSLARQVQTANVEERLTTTIAAADLSRAPLALLEIWPAARGQASTLGSEIGLRVAPAREQASRLLARLRVAAAPAEEAATGKGGAHELRHP